MSCPQHAEARELLRQYSPRPEDIDALSDEEVKVVAIAAARILMQALQPLLTAMYKYNVELVKRMAAFFPEVEQDAHRHHPPS